VFVTHPRLFVTLTSSPTPRTSPLPPMSIFCVVDDKHIPLYRILWIAAVPHFCGHEDCTQEGNYEVRLEQGESIWANREERDGVLKALEHWQGAVGDDDDWEEEQN
jgi:hypothetical protein